VAIRTVAQAAADIRLSDAKANADWERIRRELIAKATRLEADMAIKVAVTVDQNALRNIATGLDRLNQAVPPITVPIIADAEQALGEIVNLDAIGAGIVVPVTLDTDAALADLVALTTLGVVVEVPVTANIEAAEGEIAGLEGSETIIELPVLANVEQALSDIVALSTLDVVVEVPVVVNTDQAISELVALTTLDIVVPVTTAVAPTPTPVIPAVAPISELPEGPFTVKFQADVSEVPREVTTALDSLPPVILRVLPDVSEVPPAVAKVDLPPLEVPVTAAGVGPGIEASPGLARFRAEMAQLQSEGVLVRIGLDDDQAHADLTAFGTNIPPVVIPAVADVDQAQADIAAVDADPVRLPVVVDAQQLLADLARITSGGASFQPVVIPTVLGPPPPPPPPPNVPPVVVPVNANLAPAQAQVTAFGTDAEHDFERAGDRAGSAFGRQFATTTQRVLATAALTIGGVFATSLAEGFQRFTTIQDSTASLTVALQSASAAAQVLSDVLNVVRGTPFRLDDFARAATNMIAFGIAAEKVPLFLTAIGEAAATRGSQANQFAQSLATIFGQIQAIGRINGEDVWQFGNVGVDVLRILGNTVGKTTEEIRKMISEGAITSEFALDAITQGILHGTEGINGATVAFSGTMEKLGDTLSGSIENFGAARARFGVKIIEPISDTLIAGFKSFTAVFDQLGARIEPVMAALVEGPVFDAFNQFFENAPDLIEPTIDALEGLGPALAPLGIAFGALGLGALGAVLGPFGRLIPGITTLTGALTVFAASAALLTPEIRDALIPALRELGDVGLEIGGTLVEGIGEGIQGVAPVVVRALGVLKDIGPEIQTLFTQAFGSIGELGPKITPILDNIVTFAQDALPTAFRAASQGIALVTGVAEAAAPVVNQLVLAATDLVPAFETLLNVTQAVGEVLIPVLTVVGELIGDIPVGVLQTLLGVFLGFKAVSFFQTQITGISTSVGRLSGTLKTAVSDFGEFRAAGQSSFQAVRSEVANLTKSGAVAQGFGVAIAGAFSGMALASEDAATRITGAVGAIGSVLTGLATGGVPGGIFATIGVGVGLIAQGFIDGQREAEELERSIESLADKIRSEFSDDLINLKGVINSRVFADLVDEALGPQGFTLLRSLGIDKETIRQEALAGEEQFGKFMNGLIVRLTATKDAVKNLGISDAVLGDLVAIKDEGDLLSALTIQFPTANLQQVNDVINAIGDSRKDLEGLPTLYGDIVAGTDAAADKAFVLGDAMSATGDAAKGLGDDTADAVDTANKALADWKQALLDDGITMEELREQAKLLGEQAESAADKATAAFKRFGDVLDSIGAKLDLTVASQNLDQDFRDITKSLTGIVNEDDLKKAEGLTKNIDESQNRLGDLKEQLARAVRDGQDKLSAFDDDIAQADALGLVNRAAELRARRARVANEVADDQRDIQDRIDDELKKLADVRAEMAELSTVPTTLMQQLTAQAAEANLSFFDFLLAAPTPEAQAFFQDGIVNTVQDALDRAASIGLTDPLAGARAAEAFLAPFRQSLIDGGIDPTTVDQLIAQVWPADRVALGAEQAAQAAVAAFNEDVEAAQQTDPTDVQLDVQIADLEKQREDLKAFATDHPAIEIDVAPLDKAIIDLRAKEVLATINERIAQVEEAKQVERLEGFGGPALVAAQFKTPEELAAEATQAILDQVEEVNASGKNTVELKTEFIDIDKEMTDLRTLLESQDPPIQLPAELNIENVQVAVDDAKRQAIAEQFKDLIPVALGGNLDAPIVTPPSRSRPGRNTPQSVLEDIFGKGGGAFAEGGIHGFGTMDAPHTAQIARGPRIWAEPETGGEAYIPLGMGKRVGALGVFMKVAEILDLDVRPRGMPDVTSETNVFESPPVVLPELDRMFRALAERGHDARGVDGRVVRQAMIEAIQATRTPLTQEEYVDRVMVDKLYLGDGSNNRRKAFEFLDEMRRLLR
jgi:tape measure domain-containing protein